MTVMSLRPPSDFSVTSRPCRPPSQRELYELWERHEARRRAKDRQVEWSRIVEEVRRRDDDTLYVRPRPGSAPVGSACKRVSLGAYARSALRPMPRRGRVAAVGVDTWSPCWYAQSGSPLARAIEALATRRVHMAALLPERIGGYRVGWFPDARLVFAEGRPSAAGLTCAADLSGAMVSLRGYLKDVGLPLAGMASAGFRRLDIAADLWTDSSAEGSAFLECVANVALGRGKLVAYRSGRCVESVSIKTAAGRTRARLYDKGAQSGSAPQGRWVRLEAQWRFSRAARPGLEQIDADYLRHRFWRRFESLWQASGGHRIGGLGALAERLEAAVRSGQLLPSRARSIAGYLLLSAAGVSSGARRTEYELERECRQLGLSVSLLEDTDCHVDVASILEECLLPELWR